MRLIPTSSLASLLSLAVAHASSGDVVQINEVMANPFGTDIGQEFIELSGKPSLSLDGLTIVVLEGDAELGSPTQKGRIDNVISLSGRALGSNGLMLLRDGAGTIDTNPDPSLVTGPAPGTSVVVLASASSASGFGNMTLGLENSSITVLLVRDFTGAAGNDLDTNDDGILDVTPWSSVVDAVSIINSSSAPISQSVAYAPSLGFPSAVISRTVSGFDSGAVARGTGGTWYGARTLGINPTLVNPSALTSGPYYWEPGFIYPSIGGLEYYATPGQPNGTIPNSDSVCGNRLVTSQLGSVSFYNNWGFPTLSLAGSPVSLEGSSVAQKVGAARQVVFTAAAAGVHRFQLCGSSVPNTVMVATTACGQPVTAIAANNDSSLCTSGSTRSAFEIALGAGDTVYLAVGSYMATSDPFPLSVGALTLRVDRDSDGDGVFDDQDGCPQSADLTSPLTYFIDSDLDGFGSTLTGTACATTAPSGFSTNSSDCNDSNPNAYPGAPEVCNGIDDDCDLQVDEAVTQTFYADFDGDGAGDPAVTVSACSAPSGYVAVAGDACPANGALTSPVSFFVDSDGDGYGSATSAALCSTTPPAGYSAVAGDCNDGSVAIFPGAPELCATVGTDNDCDGNSADIDADASDRVTFFSDADGDGFTLSTGALFCPGTTNAGYLEQASAQVDCDDSSNTAFPGAAELCGTVGTDNNCNGNVSDVDAGAADKVQFFSDSDGDGFTLSTGALFCPGTTNAGFLASPSSPLDCNDSSNTVFPGAAELCATVGTDNNCNGNVSDVDAGAADKVQFFSDGDGDGFTLATGALFCPGTTNAGFLEQASADVDCDDAADDAYPGAVELCATVGTDNNCDGNSGDIEADASDRVTFFSDTDGDGYTLSTGALFCPGTTNAGYLASPSSPLDCDDAAGDEYPGAVELCATVGIDNDCDGSTTDVDANAADKVQFYSDSDGDGFTLSTGALFCSGTSNAGYLTSPSSPLDCNDAAGDAYPGAVELCATVGTDNNCNGITTDVDANAADTVQFYSDSDGDGFTLSTGALFCPGTTNAGFLEQASAQVDCDDSAADEYPSAAELCATVGTDNNCDGSTTDVDANAADKVQYFSDADGDAFTLSTGAPFCSGTSNAGYLEQASADVDCDDSAGDEYPGAAELCATVGVDNNCDGSADDVDADAADKVQFYSDSDGDGFTLSTGALFCAGTTNAEFLASPSSPLDCNDSSNAVFPGAPELCNGIDDNCDNEVDNGVTFLEYHVDSDGDGYGAANSSPQSSCSPVQGSVTNALDCDDAAGDEYPGAVELCATVGTDNNCNGDASDVDAGAADKVQFYSDSDGDGFTLATGALFCPGTTNVGYLAQASAQVDCDDSAGDEYPGAVELCATVGTDNNCDGSTTDVDANAADKVQYFSDADGDAFTLSTGAPFCSGTTNAGYLASPSSPLDCNDSAGDEYPGAVELCATVGTDNNCDGDASDVDAGAADKVQFYSDADGDAFTLTTGAPFCPGTTNAGYLASPSSPLDCNDSAGDEYPGAVELCATVGTDNNCDGDASDVDAGAADKVQFYSDGDGDAFTLATGALFCPGTTNVGYLEQASSQVDCDDDSDTTFPGAPELCNDIDDNCDKLVDNGVTFLDYYVDSDGDGYGAANSSPQSSCSPVQGSVTNALDCNDALNTAFPGAAELCATVGVDNNCDGSTTDVDANAADKVQFYSDSDGDGFTLATGALFCSGTSNAGYMEQASADVDCDDTAGDEYPGAAELCSTVGIDNNCNDDASDVDAGAADKVQFYSDSDGDGFTLATGALFCPGTTNVGYLAQASAQVDCDDSAGDEYPGAVELCATVGTDNNCDGSTTDVDADAADKVQFYSDSDGDGFTLATGALFCPGTTNAGYLEQASEQVDCDDTSDSAFPGAAELCATLGVDNDCDGDSGDATDTTTYFRDADNDTYGNANVTIQACSMPSGYVTDSADCNDGSGAIYPGAPELCATFGVDNDCDGDIKDAADKDTYYLDSDGDGYGDLAESVEACSAPAGYVSNDGDACPDNPAFVVITTFYSDADGDGYGVSEGSTTGCAIPDGFSLLQGDACPDDPAKLAEGDCGCGNPDTDSDSDGVSDCLEPVLTWVPEDSRPSPDDYVTFDVNLDPVDEYVVGVQFDISYDSSRLTVPAGNVGFAVVGPNGGAFQQPVYLIHTSPASAGAAGRVVGAFGAGAGNPGVQGGTLISLRFGTTSVEDCDPATLITFNTTSATANRVSTAAGSPLNPILLRAGGLDSTDGTDPVLVGVPESTGILYVAATSAAGAPVPEMSGAMVTAQDNCPDAAVTVSVALPGGASSSAIPATFPVGQSVVTWTATDLSGNSVSASRTVVVEVCVGEPVFVTYYGDSDSDGYGVGSTTAVSCAGVPAGFAAASGDCDDAAASIYPGAPERCGTVGIDNNCNGNASDIDANASDRVTFYSDSDGDGYTLAGGALFCPGTTNAGYRATPSSPLDCDDTSSAAFPGAPELCETVGVDNDCDGSATDVDANAVDRVQFYSDSDGDGFTLATGALFCPGTTNAGFLASPSSPLDCDDGSNSAYPGAPELCATFGADNNCNGVTTDVDADAVDKVQFFSDADGDGFTLSTGARFCEGTTNAGYRPTQSGELDCDDAADDEYPGAAELCATVGVDNNCNGSATDVDADAADKVLFFTDADGDGFTLATGARFCEGTTNAGFRAQQSSPIDCNDASDVVYPGAPELCDTIDNDCDSAVDEGLPQFSYYPDADSDGYGAGLVTSSCSRTAPAGFSVFGSDNCPTVPNPTQSDCNGDGVGDACETGADAVDCNTNGTIDSCEIILSPSLDLDRNGVLDVCQGAILMLNGPSLTSPPAGTPVPVEARAFNLSVPASGCQLYLQWDIRQLTFANAAGGDNGFFPLGPAVVEEVPGNSNLRRLKFATGQFSGTGSGVTSGILARVNFTVPAGVSACSPTSVLSFAAPSMTVPTGTAIAGVSAGSAVTIPYTGVENVLLTTDAVAPTLVGVPDAVSVPDQLQSGSAALAAFVGAEVTATDNCGSATVARVVTLPSGAIAPEYPNPFPIGTTTVRWTATDPSGNASSQSSTVTIQPCEGGFITFYRDGDGDGYGTNGDTYSACASDQPVGYVALGGDCNDSSTQVNPGAAEVCNGIDDNCNSQTDEGLPTFTYYADGDRDGYGVGNAVQTCVTPEPEGYASQDGDCNDTNPAVNPGAVEVCNGIDDNCNSQTDENLLTIFYRDSDGDGYGDPDVSVEECAEPENYVGVAGDCNDDYTDAYPGAAEVCDGRDNNCNTQIDEGLATFTYYADTDGDGYGAGDAVQLCSETAPAGFVTVTGDNCPESANPTQADCDGDGVGDACEAGNTDCNDNGTVDSCDIFANPSLDANDNGTIDSCEGPLLVLQMQGSSIRSPGSTIDVNAVGSNMTPNAVGMQLYVEWDIYEMAYVSASGGDNGFNLLATPVVETVAGSPSLRRLRMTTGQFIGSGVSEGVLARLRFTLSASASLCEPTSLLVFAPPSGTVQNGTTITASAGVEIAFTPSEQVIVSTDSVVPTLVGVPGSVTSSSGQTSSGELAAFVAAASAVSATDNCPNPQVQRTVTLPSGATQQSLPTIFPEGTTTVTWVARDASGNQSAPQSASVTVNSCPGGFLTFYRDVDDDGYGLASDTFTSCVSSAPSGYVALPGDCNDTNPAVNPGAAESCNGIDDNCNEQVDEGLATFTYYADSDNDGYGLTSDSYTTCVSSAPSGYVALPGDCNDGNPAVNPGAAESCNGIDDNCNEQVDEGLPQFTYYVDGDGDGYGAGAAVQLCSGTAPDGYSANDDDNCPSVANPTQADCDGDGTGDACETGPGSEDCNENGIPDSCDLASGGSFDSNGNGIIDSCEGALLTLRLQGPVVRAPGAQLNVDVVAENLPENVRTLQLYVEWDVYEMTYTSASGGDNGFAILSPATQETVSGSPNLRRLRMATGLLPGGVPGGVLARLRFAVAASASICEPTSLLAFAPPSGTFPSGTRMTGVSNQAIAFSPVEQVIVSTDGTAPVLVGVPASVTSTSGQTDSGDIATFVTQANAVTATDNCTASPTIEMTVTLPGGATQSTLPAVFPDGVTTVTWTARDAIGNESAQSRTVTVSACAGTIITFYPDGDGDSYGRGTDTIEACSTDPQPGYATQSGDCNDGNPAVNPGAAESCNGIDDNCNQQVDEGLAAFTYYADGDDDGYGLTSDTYTTCVSSAPAGYVTLAGDCNDTNPAVNPGAAESCNGIDDNCNQQVDEGVLITFYLDDDGDGYGDDEVVATACTPPADFVAQGGDCDDADADSYPGAVEVCDGSDNNCNEQVDEGLDTFTYYVDADDDGYGAGDAVQLCAEAAPEGYATVDGDNCPAVANPSQADCDGDGIGDACPIAADPDLYDCNDDGVLDSCEIAADPNLDLDGNGTIDECQGPSIKLTTAASTVEPDGYFYVDLSETRFAEQILSGSFHLNYDASLIEYIVLEGDAHYDAYLDDEYVSSGIGTLRLRVQAIGPESTTLEVIMARILVKASNAQVCAPESMMWFAGGLADNTVAGASGPLTGYSLYEKALMAFDATAPVISGVPENILAYAGPSRDSMVIPPYANSDVYAIDACDDSVVTVSLRVTLPDGTSVTTMPAAFPVGMSVVRWTAVDVAGNVSREIRIVEVVPENPPPCSADIWPGDGSDDDSAGVVDGDDLAYLMSSWGTFGGPADIDGNGIVGAGDLTYLLGAWGPCP